MRFGQETRLSRRRFGWLGIRLVATAIGVGAAAGSGSSRASSETPDSSAVLRDHCYWESRQQTIIDGHRWEYRCEICCAGGVCETVQCTWFDLGPA